MTRAAAKPPKVLGLPNTRWMSRIACCVELLLPNASEWFTTFDKGIYADV